MWGSNPMGKKKPLSAKQKIQKGFGQFVGGAQHFAEGAENVRQQVRSHFNFDAALGGEGGGFDLGNNALTGGIGGGGEGGDLLTGGLVDFGSSEAPRKKRGRKRG